MNKLSPLPIDFEPGVHRYTWRPTGERLTHSVTRILQASKNQQTLDTFKKTKHIWAPRGTYVHDQLEQHLLGKRGPYDQWVTNYQGDYEDYVKPLLDYPIWQHFEPIALEYRVCDLKRGIGGSLDVLGYDHKREQTILLDLKTLGKSSRPYKTDAQLGGYLSMLIDHHKITVDDCLTLWASNGKCSLGSSQPPDQCLQAWEDAYDLWLMRRDEL